MIAFGKMEQIINEARSLSPDESNTCDTPLDLELE